MDAATGSNSSGDVSSTFATDQQGPRADPELYLIAVTRRNLAPIAPSRVRLQLGRNGTEPPTIIFLESRDGDADADAGADNYDDDGFGAVPVPASGVAIACLPETTVGVGGEGEARESGQCVVCLGEYEAGDALRTMPCTHGFHERCIFEWLRVSHLCPICRFALPAEEGA